MKIVATFAWSWEPAWMVDQVRENLSWVDGLAVIDDRADFARRRAWGHEGALRRRQIDLCREMGADWILSVDVDERLEDRAEGLLRELSFGPKVNYRLQCCDLWEPNGWRVDGRWSDRRRIRFVPLEDITRARPFRPVHSIIRTGSQFVDIDLRFYHLKHVEAKSRAARQRMLRETERTIRRGPDARDYAYVTDESGLVVREVEPGREFHPPYRPFEFSWR